MKDKINIAELLKDCPKGMELDCTMFDGVYFDHVDESRHNSIKCYVNNGNEHFEIAFDENGKYISNKSAKCVIFPKGKTTWEGFQRPFKDGDIIFTRTGNYNWISIFKQFSGNSCCTHIDLCTNDNDLFPSHSLCNIEDITTQRIAIAEEKQKLFQAIKDNGYKWNPDDKTLEKIDYQYPKTYEKCCDMLNIGYPYFKTEEDGISASTYKNKLFGALKQLLICRDAYWKIAGNWRPEFRFEKKKYCIITKDNKVISATVEETNRILVFPTEEMRDAFYENFKELIMKCKELL